MLENLKISNEKHLKKPAFRIRTSLNADPDPDPGFYLNTDPDSGFQILIQGLFCQKIKINGKFPKISSFSGTFFAF